MKKLYTLSHNKDLLKQIDNNRGRFTAEEHSYITEAEFKESVFKTKDNLLYHYLSHNSIKLSSFGLIIDSIKNNGFKNILSLGAGQCVLEYLLKTILPEDIKVTASDFDSFFIQKAKEFFPAIITKQFDFFKDKIEIFQQELNIKFDLAIFFGSAYAMDNGEFIKLFSDLRKVGIKQIIDFHGGYLNPKDIIMKNVRNALQPFKNNSLLRKIFHKPPVIKKDYQGKFHGYTRNKKELRELYKKSGFIIAKETFNPAYKYIAILEPLPMDNNEIWWCSKIPKQILGEQVK